MSESINAISCKSLIEFFILRLWLILLSVLSSIVLCYRVLLLSPAVRLAVLRQFTFENKVDSFDLLKKRFKVGDWLLLTQLGRNLDMHHFTVFINGLQQEFKRRKMEEKDMNYKISSHNL